MQPFRTPHPGPNLNEKDDDLCTPLHVAILNGNLQALKMLLDAGARVTSKCDGCPPLHMAVCVATHPHHAAFGVEAVRLLIDHGAVVLDRDDTGRTPLHWAAASGLVDVARVLLDAATAFSESQQQQQHHQQHDNVGEVDGDGNPQDHDMPPPQHLLPSLQEFQDKQGNTALHLAARYCHPAMVNLLLHLPHGPPPPTAIKQRNKSGMNVVHMAALGGCLSCIQYVVAASPPSVAVAPTRQGLTPAALAAKRGHAHVQAAALLSDHPSPSPNKHSPPPSHHRPKHTLIIAPPECLSHHTAPWPIARTEDAPPPENVNRLVVLTRPGVGILKTSEFDELVRWDERPRRAAIGDILRVHNWAYVRKIQTVCDSLPDDPSEIGQLDGDTAISRRTFAAALAAAGAVTHAVDEVMTAKARNVFCAVRPPGHHAGPSGVVTSSKDPTGSHGFCLFNNVAIGAAYAMTVYRHAGIKRVAILDFDVHHGNGTEACVANTAPSLAKYAISTAFGEGVQQFPVYCPWRDVDDKDNIFFASVQGYGPKAPGYLQAYVYPGSGATCDTRRDLGVVEAVVDEEAVGGGVAEIGVEIGGEVKVPAPTVAATVEGGVVPNGGTNTTATKAEQEEEEDDVIEEDPDGEFVYQGGEMPRSEGPRIIDVGIPGPGSRVALWRRSWRDKILPALVKFDPDLIFVSAGFDAHKKDDINFAYIGVHEKDYEWITDQIVQVANRCCGGRVVSVLEGGYKIQGKVVSAFARSVAAHVRAMAEANGQEWDARDAGWEREHEKQIRAEAEMKRAAAAAARMAEIAEAQRAAAAAAAAAAVEVGVGVGATEGTEGLEILGSGEAFLAGQPSSPPPVMIASPNIAAATRNAASDPFGGDGGGGGGEGDDDGGGGRRKRRRSTVVDYVALNKKLQDEESAKQQVQQGQEEQPQQENGGGGVE